MTDELSNKLKNTSVSFQKEQNENEDQNSNSSLSNYTSSDTEDEIDDDFDEKRNKCENDINNSFINDEIKSDIKKSSDQSNDLIKKTSSHESLSENNEMNENTQKSVTFSEEQLETLQKENEILVDKILTPPKKYFKNEHPLLIKKKASAAVNRKKAQWKIDRDNLILLKKIQSVKSSGISVRKNTAVCRETKLSI